MSITTGPTTATMKQPKRWVDDRIAQLDGVRDYDAIISLIANYKLNDFIMNLTYATGFMSNTVPVGGSDAIAGTGKAQQRPQTRYLDTMNYFWEWFFKGPDHPDVQASLLRLNRLHAHLYDKFPESFRDRDEWIFTMCNLGCGADRMRDIVGAPRQPENVQVAWHTFWEKVSRQMTGPDGHFTDFPGSYDAMIAFAEDFESREHPYTPTGNKVANLLMDQFNEKFLPKPLHGAGRSFILTFVPPTVRKRHSLPRPNRAIEFLTKKAFRLMFFAIDHFAPDNRVSNSDRLASAEFEAERKKIFASEKNNPLPKL
ncbi:oxygenase MpaB family protein [Corynebacterium sp. YIM 101645]|uniref:Oxygenase MpaB family protein n=1 Tax=Corynebacterium lemuris TaxID=1859292 RepID=A0ABT2FYH3_9CORY|nr:oxygenase MpaB family protein [Corynebacterium lemuris]MCS5480054.1 oxygenase MpaB family protein [Corynebacterium lemuris]